MTIQFLLVGGLNLGQEPVFFKRPFFKLFPQEAVNLFSAASSMWELEQ